MKKQVKQAAACVVESLEQRQMLTATLAYGTSELENGTLIVQGTPKADTIRISRNHDTGTLDVNINGTITSHDEADIDRIRVYLHSGSDDFIIDDTNIAGIQAPIGGQVWVFAGNGNDSVVTGAANDTIIGGKGDDAIDSYAGNDSVDGGAGDDHIFGNAGIDTLRGGPGEDFITTGNKGDRVFSDGGDIVRRRLPVIGVMQAVKKASAPASPNFFTFLTWKGDYTRPIVNSITLQPGVGAKIHFEDIGAISVSPSDADISLFQARIPNVGFMEAEAFNLVRNIAGKLTGRGQGVVRLLDGTFVGFIIRFEAKAFRSRKHDVVQGEFWAISKRGRILSQGLVPIMRGTFESSPDFTATQLPPPSGLGGVTSVPPQTGGIVTFGGPSIIPPPFIPFP